MKPLWILLFTCCLSSCFPQEDSYFPMDAEISALFPLLYQTGDTLRFEVLTKTSADTLRFVVQEKQSYLTTGTNFGDYSSGQYHEVQELSLKNIDGTGDIVLSLGVFDLFARPPAPRYFFELKYLKDGYMKMDQTKLENTVDTLHFSEHHASWNVDLAYSGFSGIVRLEDLYKKITLTQLP